MKKSRAIQKTLIKLAELEDFLAGQNGDIRRVTKVYEYREAGLDGLRAGFARSIGFARLEIGFDFGDEPMEEEG